MQYESPTDVPPKPADLHAREPGTADDQRWPARFLLAISALSLGMAINAREGMVCQPAIWWLDVCVITCIAAAFVRAPWASAKVRRWLPILVLTGAAAIQFAQLYRQYPLTVWNVRQDDPRMRPELSRLRDQRTWIRDPAELAATDLRIARIEQGLGSPYFQIGILLAAGLTAASLLPWKYARSAGMPLILAVHLALGIWAIRSSPNPHIDVHVFQQESCAAILRGQNPYAITFTNIYGPGSNVYGPGLMTRDGRVNFGFPYTPVSLLLALPGYLLGGDHRYAQLLALTISGAFIAYCRPGLVPKLAALLLLFTPRVFMVVELAWTEPFVVLLLSATIFCACRYPRLTPYALGLFLASKQYLLFAIPLAALLLPPPFTWRSYLRLMVTSLLVAAVVSLPMIIWNPATLDGVRAFIRSAVVLQFNQPFRSDALSYLAWLWWSGYKALAMHIQWMAFAAAVAAVALALWKCVRGPAGFAAGIALAYLAFFVFNKQAFCNYYFFVISAICCAIAAAPCPAEASTARCPGS